MEYGGYNVVEKYSQIVEPNLYFDSIFQPGMTYNDQFQGDADSGLVKIFKLPEDDVQDPKTPASDFSHEAAENELIDLRLNNLQSKSKKIYKIQANAVPYAMAEEHLALATQNCRQGWQASGLACLAHEGTVLDLSLNEQTGELSMTREEVDKLTDAYKEQAIQQAFSQHHTELTADYHKDQSKFL